MSTLSAARADNFYYPPGWDPGKESLSVHTGDTKGRNQYEQLGLIRFELPFDGWCLGCSRHVGKGVRFNAKKDADGKYHSTTIWKFTMQCPSCTTKFVIKTDPAANDYDFFSGIRRKVESYEANEADGARALVDTDHRAQAAELAKRADPIARLERRNDDTAKAKRLAGELAEDWDRAARFEDDYEANRALRKRHRAKRKDHKERDAMAANLGLTCELLPPSADDARQARAVTFQQQTRRAPKIPLHRQSIFGASNPKLQTAAALARDRGIALALRRRDGAPDRQKTPALHAKKRRR